VLADADEEGVGEDVVANRLEDEAVGGEGLGLGAGQGELDGRLLGQGAHLAHRAALSVGGAGEVEGGEGGVVVEAGRGEAGSNPLVDGTRLGVATLGPQEVRLGPEAAQLFERLGHGRQLVEEGAGAVELPGRNQVPDGVLLRDEE